MSDAVEISPRLEWIVDGLVDAGEDLPSSLTQRILAAGSAAVPTLIAILTDVDLQSDDGPAEGWPSIHAAELLGELRAEEAVGPLVQLVADFDADTFLCVRAKAALCRIGPRALEPLLARHAAATTGPVRRALTDVLAGLGAPDERVFQILVEHLSEDAVAGAMKLASYGDPRALPHLSRAFDALVPEHPDSPLGDQDLLELQGAIEDLGGALTPAQQQRLHEAGSARRRWRQAIESALLTYEPGSEPERATDAPSPAIEPPVVARHTPREPHRAPPTPSRNATCPCGSGAKYKKCCLKKDEAARRAAAPATP